MSLIAPMMAQLGVTNAARSLAFYRDVLGFEHIGGHVVDGHVFVATVRSGPAMLQVAEHDGITDSPDQRYARHGTILFFECDDVVVRHAAITARGGAPTGPCVVDYWMRMKMFEMHDPDNHCLWFGQRTDEPISGHDET